ncbi:MAG: cohesin domain-containing protein [Candidatus Binatia bacterium]
MNGDCPGGYCNIFSPPGVPPDPNGAVGAYQYVQWVNKSFAVFNKGTGALECGPIAGNVLWSGFQGDGGFCANHNNGDPIVAYDKLANRWVMTQFALVDGQTYEQCIAVSTSENALGTWYRYAYTIPSFNDYPKLGVWPDGYYMAFNMFACAHNGCAFQGARICAYDRNAMLNGAGAAQQCFQLSTAYSSLLPSDLDGPTPPPVGAPNYFLRMGSNALAQWQFHADFAGGHPTLTGPMNISVAAFTPACNGGACIPQAGTSGTLDSLADRLMHRLAYRNFGDHDTLVVTHSVGSPSGIRWYEIRSPGPNPVVYQQGTFSPDSSYRWMGSIAMDPLGDIAVGYSVSNASMNPAIRYTGRVPNDPPGTLETENVIFAGTGSQTTYTRWGDYTSMTVDPVFDCSLWYTNEYLQSTGVFNWHTRITSFRFPSCVGCVGDCNRDHVVTQAEVNTMTNIDLGNLPIIDCLRGDANGDGQITVDEILTAVNNMLNGCPAGSTAPVGGAVPLPGPIAGKTITQQIGSASGAPGTTITIPVTVTNGGGIVSATQVDLLYPAAVMGNPSCVKAPRLTNYSVYTSLPSDPPAPAGERRLRTLVIDLSSPSTFTDGQIFSCTFTILTSAQPGTYAITGERQGVSDHLGEEIISTVANGSVTVY